MKTDIEEFIKFLGTHPRRQLVFEEQNLPNTTTSFPIVQFPREVLEHFRINYRILLSFAALVLNLDIQEVTPAHLMKWVMEIRRFLDMEDNNPMKFPTKN